MKTILFFLSALPVLADIELQTSIDDVYYRGPSELNGVIYMSVNSDDFSTASPEHPVYLRISLTENATLSATLVDQNATGGTVSQPIYLATELISAGSALSNSSPTDTLSIVRWVSGEQHIWLKVQHSSSTWITDGSTLQAPNASAQLGWLFGVSARSSWNDHQVARISNMPFNTRNPLTQGDLIDATSTRICTDLSESTLELGQRLEFSAIAYASDARLSPGVFGPGTPYPLNFTNNFEISRAKDRNCFVIQSDPATESTSKTVANGLVTVTQKLSFTLTCFGGGGLLSTALYSGASFRLTVASDRSVGFFPGGAAFDLATPGIAIEDPDSAFMANNTTLFKSLDLIYDGPREFLGSKTLILEVALTVPLDEFTTRVSGELFTGTEIDWELKLVNHDNSFDEPPFDGSDQLKRCDPGSFSVGNDRVPFDMFLPADHGARLTVRSTWETANWLDVAISGNEAYVLGKDRLEVYDLSTPASLKEIRRFPLNLFPSSAPVQELHYAKNKLFFNNGDMVKIVSFDGQKQLQEHGTINPPSYIYHMVVSGDLAALFTVDGLLLFDTSNPDQPVPRDEIHFTPSASSIALSENTAFVAFSDTLRVYDITDPANIAEIGQVVLAVGYGPEITVEGDYAYVGGNTGFAIYNISTPANPTLAGIQPIATGRIEIDGATAWTRDGLFLKAIDISDPANPTLLRQCA